ncbi:hypothetical protein BJY52DRAFT_428090 [Lactarius psammicola]|nr:hypothetical protein BJY52DRAFT_428090 [Lactarius psammicola]
MNWSERGEEGDASTQDGERGERKKERKRREVRERRKDTLGGSAGVCQFLALYIIRYGAVLFLSRSVHMSYFIFHIVCSPSCIDPVDYLSFSFALTERVGDLLGPGLRSVSHVCRGYERECSCDAPSSLNLPPDVIQGSRTRTGELAERGRLDRGSRSYTALTSSWIQIRVRLLPFPKRTVTPNSSVRIRPWFESFARQQLGLYIIL